MVKLQVSALGESTVNQTWVALILNYKKDDTCQPAINEAEGGDIIMVPQISEKGGTIFKSVGNLANFCGESYI